MEMISSTTPFYRSMKKYWRRRQYQRLDATNNNTRVIRLGGKRKRSWRIRVIPKLKLVFKVVSPIRLLAKLRDAYIDMMLGVAGKVGSLNGDSVFGPRRIPKARKVSSKVSKAEEFQTKLILEIYKSLKASRELDSKSLVL